MPKAIDISGQRFGKLTVICRHPEMRKYGRSLFECRCDCGNTIFQLPDPLKRGIQTSCKHCLGFSHIGKKFNSLTIISFSGCQNRLTMGICKCDCGNLKELSISRVIKGKIRSCGCLRTTVNKKKASAHLKKKNHFLKVVGLRKENNKHILVCKCKCGNKTEIRTGCLKRIKSCGCLQKISTPKGENCGLSKLSNFEAETIRELYKSNSGYDKYSLSLMFAVGIDCIKRIINNETYKINEN